MESKTLVLLAGGMASRLNKFLNTQDKVKCLVSFNGKSFLNHLLNQAVDAGFKHVIILGGPDTLLIQDEVRKMNYDLRYSFPEEKARLGTGGSLALTASCIQDEYIFLSNADTYFEQNPFKIIKGQTKSNAAMTFFMRDSSHEHTCKELSSEVFKPWPDLYQTGSYVYSGISVIKSEIVHNWASMKLPTVCSFEKDVFTRLKYQSNFVSYPFKEIDFGTEVGYRSLQAVFQKKEVV